MAKQRCGGIRAGRAALLAAGLCALSGYRDFPRQARGDTGPDPGAGGLDGPIFAEPNATPTKPPPFIEVAQAEDAREPPRPTEPVTALPDGDATVEVLANAVQTKQMEIQMGHLAHARATSPAIRQYGALLSAQDESASQKVTLTVKTGMSSIPMPGVPMDRLRTLEGRAFDRAFTLAMVAGYEDALVALDRVRPTLENEKVTALLVEQQELIRNRMGTARRLGRSLGQ